jgi:hypothetical protein
MAVLNGGIQEQIEIQKAVWSTKADVVLSGLEKIKLLLGLTEICVLAVEKLEYSSALYAIYSAITGSDQAPAVAGEYVLMYLSIIRINECQLKYHFEAIRIFSSDDFNIGLGRVQNSKENPCLT